MSVVVEHSSAGGAAEFHGRTLPDRALPQLWWFSPERSAVVLGSTQDPTILDTEACERMGLDVVKRRSGGGIVLVGPGSTLWLDVLVPRGHRLWDDDVARASWWVGETWADALREFGVDDVSVHRGSMVTSELARLVCFAGRGPGEVFAATSKAVGISQRRTRDWSRFQCALSLRWDGPRHVTILRDPPAASLEGLGTDLEIDVADMTTRLTDAFRSRLDG